MAVAMAASLSNDSSVATTHRNSNHLTQIEEDEALAKAIAASLQESAQKPQVSFCAKNMYC